MPKAINQRALQEVSVRHFLEVVRAGSITEAAVRLNLAPSAVSRQIAHLESELDTLLFDRRGRGMSLNAAGELLAVHAKRAWQDIEQVAEEIRALRGVRAGIVRIGSTEGFAYEFVPRLVAEFRQEYPGVRFTLAVGSQAEIPRMVREGDVDIGLTVSLVSERNITVEMRHPAPIVAILSPDHPLAARRQLSLAQLTQYPLALPGPESTLRQLFDISCSRQGIQCEPAFLSSRLDALLSFAAAGGGIALSGEAVLRNRLRSGVVKGIPLRDREMNERHFEVQTSAGRTLSNSCRSFIDFLQATLQRSAKP